MASSWYPHADNPNHCIFVHQYAVRLKRFGLIPYVITVPYSSRDSTFEIRDGVPVRRLKSTLRNPYIFLLSVLSVIKIFRNHHIVHVHAADPVGMVFALIAKLSRLPVVLTVHRADIIPSAGLGRSLKMLFLKLIDQIIAVSDETKRLALECGVPEHKISVVYNAVDEKAFFPRSKVECRLMLGLPLYVKLILFVGNLIPRKGLKYLMKATAQASKYVRKMTLIIVGDGLQRRELESYAKSLRVSNHVIFTGRISMEKLAAYYGSADVFVLPSMHEGHAMVLLEAMSSGLPVIATNVGGNIETVFHGKNGYLVPYQDSDALAKSLVEILRNERMARNFGETSLQIYRSKFSEENQVYSVTKIYSDLTKSRRSGMKSQANAPITRHVICPKP